MSTGDAIRTLRSDPHNAALITDSYLDEDLAGAARRFAASDEWRSVMELAGKNVVGKDVLDLGAGTGIATYALLESGARRVLALEPDPSDVVGYAALTRLVGDDSRALIVSAFGESIPLRDQSIDLVYLRQVLHHIDDLESLARECFRVLRPGGAFLATREHVVDDEAQLRQFLEMHAIHQLTGGENAHSLARYTAAIAAAGLTLEAVMGPWDSVINAFPAVRSSKEIEGYPADALRSRLGAVGAILARVPGVKPLIWRRIRRPKPGRLYTFVARRAGPE